MMGVDEWEVDHPHSLLRPVVIDSRVDRVRGIGMRMTRG